VEFGHAGYRVHGFDIDTRRVSELSKGKSYIQDVPSADVRSLVQTDRLIPTTNFQVLRELDAVNVCVPTPLSKQKDPDVSYIVAASREVARYLHPGMLVILESTTYPGTTEELILPMLEREGMKVGRDFFLAFSPERVDPGNNRFNTRNIPKVVGGVTPTCTEVAVALYRQRLENVVPVSSTQVAEMVKLLENTFRSVNIGMVNEMALLCGRWASMCGKSSKPQPPSRSASCPSIQDRVLAATAFRSIPSTSPGKPGPPASRRASSSWRGTSTGTCPSTWSTWSPKPEYEREGGPGIPHPGAGRGLQGRHR
jgi:hypothetical protein